jgi:tetratricopeptide (TPR) repeat protein
MRSAFGEGRRWLGRVLGMPGAPSLPDLCAAATTQLAHHAFLQGDRQEATPAGERALALARAHGRPRTLADALLVSGLVLALEGRFADAGAALEASAGRYLELHDQWGHALALMSLGYLAHRRDDTAIALARCERALAAFRALGDPYFQSVCLHEVGGLRGRGGDWAGSSAGLRESLALARDLGSPYEIAAGLLRLAEAEQHLGQPARAVRLYCAARHGYDAIGAWRAEANPQLEERLARCRAALGDAAFATAMGEGRAMTIAQAIALDGSPG